MATDALEPSKRKYPDMATTYKVQLLLGFLLHMTAMCVCVCVCVGVDVGVGVSVSMSATVYAVTVYVYILNDLALTW